MNAFDEIEAAVDAARELNDAVDVQSTSLARLLVGRLRHVNSGSLLAQLKAELAHFDSRGKTWKGRK